VSLLSECFLPGEVRRGVTPAAPQGAPRLWAKSCRELVTDIFSVVQSFGVFRNSEKLAPGEIGKALWDKSQTYPDLTSLYDAFALYALEEVSRAWYRYLEANSGYKAELAA